MKTKMHSKAIWALLLCAAMVLTMIPVGALPVNATETSGVTYYINEDFSTEVAFVNTTSLTTDAWWRPSATGTDKATQDLENGNVQVADLRYQMSTALTENYTVEFSYYLPQGSTGKLEVSNGFASTTSRDQIFLQFTGALDTDANGGDRVNLNGTTKYFGGSAANYVYGQWHAVKMVVDQEKGVIDLYLDGSDTPALTGEPIQVSTVTQVNRATFFSSNGDLLIDNVKIYTKDMEGADSWTVKQQATLGENIYMNFTGTVGSLTGITKVQASLGNKVVADDDLSDGFDVTVPVAAAEMAETITLEGLNAEGTAVQTETYTVEAYLNEVKATDENKYGSIVDHTLNYGAAAATYFGKTAVTVPTDLTTKDVPSAADGGYVTVTDLRYTTSTTSTITENYTMEFDYCLPSDSKGEVDLSNGSRGSSNNQVVISLTGDGAWHTATLEVDQTSETKTYDLYIDGKATVEDGAITVNKNPNRVTLYCTSGSLLIDNVKLSGSTEYINEDFNGTFTYATTQVTGWWSNAETVATHTPVTTTNPVSGTCTGIAAKSATLLFKDKVEIRYSFELESDSDIADYTFSIGGKTLPLTTDGNYYYVTSEGIYPQDYETDVELTVTKGEETMTVTYSPMDYITRMCSKETEEATAMKPLLQAMYNYYLNALEYKTQNPNG